jgi:hypothetical protein
MEKLKQLRRGRIFSSQVFGRWTVLGRAEGHYRWLCRCECGVERTIFGSSLLKGDSQSCGCLQRELAADRHSKGPNEVKHLGTGVSLFILYHKGQKFECAIDTTDYEIVRPHHWSVSQGGRTFYAHTTIKGKHVSLHRLLLPTENDVDHKDRNGLNNRRQNLRPANDSQNNANQPKLNQDSTSSLYKGVAKHSSGKFEAYCGGKHLGLFDSEVEAALAYDATARQQFGEFAVVNFPRPGEQGAIRKIDDTPEGEEP